MRRSFFKRLLCLSPKAYIFLLHWKRRGHWSSDWIVRKDSEIVIEGFPRSGNSFARSAFQRANPGVQKIATHVHSPAQVILAVQYKRPTVVMLRRADDAVVSLIAFSAQLGQREIEGSKNLKIVRRSIFEAYRSYINFYKKIEKHKSDFVYAPFEEITSDFGKVIDKINARFDTQFERFSHNAEAVQKIFNAAPVHLGPREDRNAIKQSVNRIIRESRYDQIRHKAALVYRQALNSIPCE